MDDKQIIFGAPPERESAIAPGTEVIVRLYAFCEIGTLRSGQYNSLSNRLNLSFETLCVIGVDDETGEETYDYTSAGKVFNEDIGAQPYGIHEMLFKQAHITGIFAKLQGPGYEPREGGGFTLDDVANVVGACYRVTVGEHVKGQAKYICIDSLQRRLHEKQGDTHISAAMEVMTLNDFHVFHPYYDYEQQSEIRTAAQLVTSRMFKRLRMSHRNMVRKSNEFQAFPDYEQYAEIETNNT